MLIWQHLRTQSYRGMWNQKKKKKDRLCPSATQSNSYRRKNKIWTPSWTLNFTTTGIPDVPAQHRPNEITTSSSTLWCLSFWQKIKNSTCHKNHKATMLLSFTSSVVFFSVGDRCWPQLQPHISNQNWRLRPGDRSAIPRQPGDWRAVGSQSSGLRGADWLRSHVHFHCRGRGHGGNHASWTSIGHCQNHGGCVCRRS